MSDVKFVKYESVNDDKFCGIITVLATGPIYLKYKVAAGKNGGFYPNACSIKKGDEYQKAYMAGDPMLQEEIDSCLKANINRVMNDAQPTYRAPQPSYQPQEPASNIGECPF